MDQLQPGIYDQLISLGLLQIIGEGDAEIYATDPLTDGDAADRFALYVGRQLERAINAAPEDQRVEFGADIANKIISAIGNALKIDDFELERPARPVEILRGVGRRRVDGTTEQLPSPKISLLDTALLTNAPDEPGIGSHIASELASSSSVDLVMAFITWGGIQNLRHDLETFLASGRRLRILTTTFTGTTDKRSLDWLTEHGAQVRVSYTKDSSRLHAKAWLFERPMEYSTAYIGSANLTHTALSPGREWNIRVSGIRNLDIVEKVQAVFNSYWENPDFRPYDPVEFEEQSDSAGPESPQIFFGPISVRPMPFQERLLEQLQASRSLGHHRNLLVAATGTGKTVMSALDYRQLLDRLDRGRLLFIAHRKEILKQSQDTFCQVLQDYNFGEQWVDGKKPKKFDHVFASIQSLHASDLEHLAPDHFDVVVIDEFHHAAASSYKRILEHLKPKELVGLTATPERADGLSILDWFDGRIAAELRLWDAIDQQYLSPFWYFGIHDGTDLTQVPWKRGMGYDSEKLSEIYTGTDVWAKFVLKQFMDRTQDPSTARAIGFCVNVDHARYMARIFSEGGISSVAVWASTPAPERERALADLEAGKVNVLFSVDLFNEGVDVPTVDVLLLLRPTESSTLFLQQLGRGLRKAKEKEYCLVLDFVGQHRQEFRFDRPLRALLGGTRRQVQRQVEEGFPLLPSGCSFELDEKSSEIILRSLKNALPSTWSRKVEELRSTPGAEGMGLAEFLESSGLDVSDIYEDGKRSWSDLRESAGMSISSSGPEEKTLRRALGRLLHVNDPDRIAWYRQIFSFIDQPETVNLSSARQRRATRMLLAQLLDKVSRDHLPNGASLEEALAFLALHRQVCREGIELMDVMLQRVDHTFVQLDHHDSVPLLIHGVYTRSEILAAFDHGKGVRTTAWQSGVLNLPDERVDLFAVTIDKSSGNYSPKTRYKDYAISPRLFHWESQSTTRAASGTGQRYQHHESMGHEIMIFARRRQEERGFWFLGPAKYRFHKGEMPMGIEWELLFPLPGDLFSQFAAVVA